VDTRWLAQGGVGSVQKVRPSFADFIAVFLSYYLQAQLCMLARLCPEFFGAAAPARVGDIPTAARIFVRCPSSTRRQARASVHPTAAFVPRRVPVEFLRSRRKDKHEPAYIQPPRSSLDEFPLSFSALVTRTSTNRRTSNRCVRR
jgi:hypothetical protein